MTSYGAMDSLQTGALSNMDGGTGLGRRYQTDGRKRGATRDRKAAKERWKKLPKGHPCKMETDEIQDATVKIQEVFEIDFVCHFDTCGGWCCIGGH